MRKHALVLGGTFLALAAFSVFAGWTFFSGSRVNGAMRVLGPLWPYAVGGLAIAVALVAVLLWVAFYSTHHRYDDGVDGDESPSA